MAISCVPSIEHQCDIFAQLNKWWSEYRYVVFVTALADMFVENILTVGFLGAF